MTLADAALIGMQWIQEAQDGRTTGDTDDDSGGGRADDGVLPDSQPDGAVKRKHNRYCGMCDRLTPRDEYECRLCGADTDKWD